MSFETQNNVKKYSSSMMILFVLSEILMFINLIFTFSGIISYKIAFIGGKYSAFGLIDELTSVSSDGDTMFFVIKAILAAGVVFIVISALLMILPWVAGKAHTGKYPAAAILALLFSVIVQAAFYAFINYAASEAFIDVIKLTFTGDMYFVESFVTFIILVIYRTEIKKFSKNIKMVQN